MKLNKILFKIYSILPTNIQKIWENIEKSDIQRRITSAAFWSLTGAVISQSLLILTSIIVARILGLEEFGELGIIRSTISMFSVFAGFGLGLTATKYVAELKIKDKEKTGKIIGLTTLFAVAAGFVIAIIIFVFAPFIAETTLNSPHLVDELRLSAVILFFSAINGSLTGTLYGFESFKLITKVTVAAGLLSFPVQIGFTLIFGLYGSLLGLGFSVFVLCVFNLIAIRKEAFKLGIIIQFKKSLTELPIIYKFSLPALFSGLMVTPTIWFCNTMLVNQPNGFAEMALFSASNQWSSAVLFVPTVISKIALPLLSASINENQFIRILKINVFINFVLALLIAISIYIFSSLIMDFYGEGFQKGNTVLIILAFTNIFIAINGVIGQAIAGKDKMWMGFLLNTFWSIALVTSAYVFLLKFEYGAKGLAYAFLLSYIFHTIMVTIFTTTYLLKTKT
tara:strand:+ start:881 stop:2236 length:1356 start_codon:yes stop_codon:yes gene_type:complete